MINTIIRGAARQFGAEFGRAGANSILKGKNAIYTKRVSDRDVSQMQTNSAKSFSWPKAALFAFLGWVIITEVFKLISKS